WGEAGQAQIGKFGEMVDEASEGVALSGERIAGRRGLLGWRVDDDGVGVAFALGGGGERGESGAERKEPSHSGQKARGMKRLSGEKHVRARGAPAGFLRAA